MKLFSPLKTTSILVAATFIGSVMSGCTGNYTFESHLKADGAHEYFSASHVEVFNDVDEFTTDYQFIGLVEGEECQKEPHLAPPDPVNARTKARQAADLQHANAVIFTSCVDINTQYCVAQVVCYGKAYRLATPK